MMTGRATVSAHPSARWWQALKWRRVPYRRCLWCILVYMPSQVT